MGQADDAGIDPGASKSGMERAQFHLLIEGNIQMLQIATAANPKMPASRRDAFRARNYVFDDATLATTATSRAESGTHSIARNREGQEYRCASKPRNAVAVRSQTFDRQFEDLRGIRPRARH